ncbi:MAG: DGQHR domain-containing protein [Burkholderiales bacterium]
MSNVSQGNHRFYTLTMPSDVLANCCFATNREEDPQSGFQRVLDEKRAAEIADYMDRGFGTIPSSIVLSAQPSADLQVLGGKTLEFSFMPHSFLIIDGQHRVYGFSKASTKLRVPVVIYNGLTKQQESSLFIDINTKQRPVPNEVLFDIKKLAVAETDDEALMGELYDKFNSDATSPLFGLMSPAKKASGKLSRVTFNSGVKPLLMFFSNRSCEFIYPALRNYLGSFLAGLVELGVSDTLANPTVFRAILECFPEVAQRAMDRGGPVFKQSHFDEVLRPVFQKTRATRFTKPPKSHKELGVELLRALKAGFIIG